MSGDPDPSLLPCPVRVQHFTQGDLAARWQMSERSLERRRYQRQGPPYIKIGARVLYRLEDIQAYEIAHLRLGRW